MHKEQEEENALEVSCDLGAVQVKTCRGATEFYERDYRGDHKNDDKCKEPITIICKDIIMEFAYTRNSQDIAAYISQRVENGAFGRLHIECAGNDAIGYICEQVDTEKPYKSLLFSGENKDKYDRKHAQPVHAQYIRDRPPDIGQLT